MILPFFPAICSGKIFKLFLYEPKLLDISLLSETLEDKQIEFIDEKEKSSFSFLTLFISNSLIILNFDFLSLILHLPISLPFEF